MFGVTLGDHPQQFQFHPTLIFIATVFTFSQRIVIEKNVFVDLMVHRLGEDNSRGYSSKEKQVFQPDPRWEFPRENLEIQQCLGEGEFGRVLKACATNINGVEGMLNPSKVNLCKNSKNS